MMILFKLVTYQLLIWIIVDIFNYNNKRLKGNNAHQSMIQLDAQY